MDKLLTKKEVAELLGVSTRTIERLVKDGKLTPVRILRQVRFDPDEIEQFIANKGSRN